MSSGRDLCDLDEIGTRVIARACASPLTRRHVDLTDALVAAAADAVGAGWVYRSDGVGVGRHLGDVHLCPPLCRLYDTGDPFAVPPEGAKRPPAGSDAVWAAALTLGVTATAASPADRTAMTQAVGARLGPLWKDLQRERLCGSAPRRDPSPLRFRISGDVHDVAVPLFGAPAISAATRTFVSAAALLGHLVLVVDDLTPRLCYDGYPADATRATYERFAAARGATASFVTDLPLLAERLDEVLQMLTLGQLAAASAGRRGRRRGGLTGHDAVHLAVMALACAQHPATIAIRSTNVAAVHAMAPVFAPSSVVVVTGDDPDERRWRADMPARHLTQEGRSDAHRHP